MSYVLGGVITNVFVISNDVIKHTVEMSEKYIHDRFLPDKAIDLIDEACSKLKICLSEFSDEIRELNKRVLELDRKKTECLAKGREDYLMANKINEEKTQILDKINKIRAKELETNGKIANEITAENIREVVSAWTKIPVNKLSSTEKEKKYPVKINVEVGKVTISCANQTGDAKEEIYVETEGKELEIGFNPMFFLDALKAIDDEEVYIEFGTNRSPCIIKPIEDGDYIYMILPIKMKE